MAAEWTRSNWEAGTKPLYETFLKFVEPAIFRSAFELTNRQYSAAARRLGIHRTTLKKKLDSSSE
jgi:DNA-binding protein Fis